MAERVVTTEAVVVGSRAIGEASAVLTLFTRELGLLQAFARGIRLQRSKLRYHIQDYHFARVTLVPGREYWRLIGAVPMLKEDTKGGPSVPEDLAFVARAGALITRFMGAHVAHPEIFDLLCRGGDLRDFQLFLLDALGYVGAPATSPAHAESLIERAYRESHL